jgi:hypothetical protein
MPSKAVQPRGWWPISTHSTADWCGAAAANEILNIPFSCDSERFTLGGVTARGAAEATGLRALDLVERQSFLGVAIELGSAGTLVRGHGLNVFQCSAVLEIGRDAGGTESMAADGGLDAGGPP